MARFFDLGFHIGRDLDLDEFFAVLALETKCFIFEQSTRHL